MLIFWLVALAQDKVLQFDNGATIGRVLFVRIILIACIFLDQLLQVVLLLIFIPWYHTYHQQITIDLNDNREIRILEVNGILWTVHWLENKVEYLLLLQVIVVFILEFHRPWYWLSFWLLIHIRFMIWLCKSEIFCKDGLSKGLKIFHFSFTHYVNREEAAGKTRLRFFGFCNMLHNGYSQSVDINIRSKLIQKFNEYHALSCSLKYKEDSISFQSSYFFLNLLIYSNWLFNLFFFLFFHFSIGFYRFRLSCNNCSDVKVRIQFFDPIIQYIKDFFDTPLLFIGIARYHEPCDPLLDFVGPLGLLKLLLVEWLLILGTSFLLSLHFIYSIMVIGV